MKIGIIEICLQLIRLLTPPIALSVLKKLLSFVGNRIGLFSKLNPSEYKSYEDAMLHCSAQGYENTDLIKVIFDKSVSYRQEIADRAAFDLHSLGVIAAVGLTDKKRILNVIDFGGASGYHYFITKRAFGETVRLRWNVVETSAMVRQAREIADEQINFFDNITEAQHDLGKVDLIFSSGALHCSPDPWFYLDEIINVNAKYIFITKTALLNQEDTIYHIHKSSLSTNGPGSLKPGTKDAPISYPNVLVSKKRFEEKLTENYIIQFSIAEGPCFSLKNQQVDMYGYYCVRRDV